ncbi:MAG: nitronate monooxygenase [Alphaproteobacteria bacterium]|nr:nitronate monooxygenase [Alphaproteobacteria bacterium]MBU1516398.1 nitronate monooxygenase [Alphaproteobacteria bacterium]MBU2093365.1 nitronate monooxygenase [Alphaproteobacteria bacterium]MBU2153852.1 nitronate monooxygenase [Alphaproteobacteria bacterium]MBU2307724.1 nitronate monooxygenase [Alphaproteobacteria bacterium]
MTARRIQTRITELFGIEHPLLLGGMMHLSDARLVAAVVNAGGMGYITPRSFDTLEDYRRDLHLCRELTGGKPFGVNLTFASRAAQNVEILDHIRIALEEGVRHFESAGNSPDQIVPLIHDGGGLLLHKCPSVRHALSAERLGVDAVALVGMEEGGHPGFNQLSAFVNGAFALERLERTPLVIGGGIGSGAQIAAALAMGADAVVMGSRFMAAAEVWAHDALKQRIIESDEHASMPIMAHLSTWRVLRNEAAVQVREMELAGVAKAHRDYGDLILSSRTKEQVYRNGDTDAGIVSFGPAGAFTEKVEPAGDIVRGLMAAALKALDGAAAKIVSDDGPDT